MYYLYLALWYLSIRSTSNYVLLAANMDDFRSLAKKFVPANIAEQFLPSAVPVLRDNSNQNRNRDVPSIFKTEEENTGKQKHKNSKKNPKHIKDKTKFDVQLDELVAKVKESLQRDWTIFLTTPNIFTSSHNDDTHITTERMAVKGVTGFDVYTSGYSPSIKQVRYVKQDRDDSKDRNKEKNRNVGQEKYVESNAEDNYISEVKPSKLAKFANVERQLAAQPKRFNKTRSRPGSKQAIIKNEDNDIFETVEEKTEQITVTDDPTDIFKETDIRQVKESYEEYVVPKKDEDYDQTEVISNTNKKKDKFNDERLSPREVADKKSNSRLGKGKNKHKKVQDYQNDRDQKKDSDIFIEEDKEVSSIYKNPEPNIDNDETINYNKKKRNERNKKKETRSISYYTPNQEDDIFATTSELPMSQKWMNEFRGYHDQNHEPHSNKKAKQRYVPSRTDVEDRQKQPERSEDNGPQRYVEVHEGSKSEIVAAPSSMYLEQDKSAKKIKKSSSNKKERINKHEIEKKRKIFNQKPNKNKNSLAETGTEDELHMFKGFDLLKSRDSYEDYVMPKKDINIYDDEEPPRHDNKDKASINFLRELATNFENEHKHDNLDNINDYNKRSDIINDYDTTYYNKKESNLKINNADSDNNRWHKHIVKEPKEASEMLPLPIEPDKPLDYGELLGEPRRHVDEFLKYRKAKEGKVRAERFLLEEMIKEGKNSIENIKNRYLRS